ncbi:MAG: acetate kinase [Proteobacteria bacterium]|nr:acetate kinase [Pseudomonadota bacterium]
MNVLVFNSGSSSVKYTCFGARDGRALAWGIVERIGQPGAVHRHQVEDRPPLERPVEAADAGRAVGVITPWLTHPDQGVFGSLSDVQAVGHRIVHGGEKMTRAVVVDEEVKAVIREYCDLAPLHNPPGLMTLQAAQAVFSCQPHVAVFDTAFHATIPEHAFLYGLPHEYYGRDKIRRYGFHGLSHGYVSREAARFLGRPIESLRMITCHLGNGCSVTAVDGGRSVDTSMGFTPLEGLIMGTRCGDIDPALVLYLMERKGLSVSEVNDLLNKQSGLKGLSGIGSGDLRDVESAGRAGNRRAKTALAAFCYRIRKYVGAYMAVLGGAEAIVFTAGIGENAPTVRRAVCDGLPDLAGGRLALDPLKNEAPADGIREVQAGAGGIRVLVVPTDEEREIAGQTRRLLAERR